MPTNYYQLLRVSEDASSEEIRQAYTVQQTKWQQLRGHQPDHLQERTDKVLLYLDKAYGVLSNPEKRAAYDLTLKQGVTLNTIDKALSQPVDMTCIGQPSSNNKLYIIIIFLLVLITLGILYLIYKTNFVATDKPIPPTTSTQSKQDTPKISAELKAALEQAEQQKKQNAQNPTLKVLAKNIADNSNKNLNTIINNNTKFIGAQAANQNVTFRFLVIDGISYSQSLLSTYFTERFIADNNEVCASQQTELVKGILYTFAYYDNKGKLLASYYIDQQVCQSPTSNRIIKRPDMNQLEAKETPLTSDPKTDQADEKQLTK